MSEQVKLSAGARADIRRDAEHNCEGATVADTLRLLGDYDAMAQRCQELEMRPDTSNELALLRAGYAYACDERDALRAEVADLKAALLEAERGSEELVRLRAERRELEKDAARLDWLAERIEDMVICGADPCVHATDEEESWPVLWRRAIDAVRKRDGAPE